MKRINIFLMLSLILTSSLSYCGFFGEREVFGNPNRDNRMRKEREESKNRSERERHERGHNSRDSWKRNR